MPFSGPVVATPKGMPLSTRSSGFGRVASPAGPAAALRYRSKVSAPLSATIQTLYHWLRARPVLRTVAPSVVTRSKPLPLSTSLNPAGTVIGSPVFVLFMGLSVSSEIRPIWGRTVPPVAIINRKNPMPVSPSAIGLVMPPTPMARAKVPELWPITLMVMLPFTVAREEFPVPSLWVSRKPPKTPLHTCPSGVPVRLSKLTTNFSSAWTAAPASRTTRIPRMLFVSNCFIIRPSQDSYELSLSYDTDGTPLSPNTADLAPL